MLGDGSAQLLRHPPPPLLPRSGGENPTAAAWEVLLGAWDVCGELDVPPFIPQTRGCTQHTAEEGTAAAGLGVTPSYGGAGLRLGGITGVPSAGAAVGQAR